MNQWIVGTLLTLKVTFKDSTGALVDPTAVVAEIRQPDLTVVALPAPTHVSTGIYSSPFTPTQSGLHHYRFAGTGTVVAAQEGDFTAQSSFTSNAP